MKYSLVLILLFSANAFASSSYKIWAETQNSFQVDSYKQLPDGRFIKNGAVLMAAEEDSKIDQCILKQNKTANIQTVIVTEGSVRDSIEADIYNKISSDTEESIKKAWEEFSSGRLKVNAKMSKYDSKNPFIETSRKYALKSFNDFSPMINLANDVVNTFSSQEIENTNSLAFIIPNNWFFSGQLGLGSIGCMDLKAQNGFSVKLSVLFIPEFLLTSNYFPYAGTFAHEFGHNLGLGHATAYNSIPKLNEKIAPSETYGDPISVMGYYSGIPAIEHLLMLEFIDSKQVLQNVTSDKYTLIPMETLNDKDIKGLTVSRKGAEKTQFWIECHKNKLITIHYRDTNQNFSPQEQTFSIGSVGFNVGATYRDDYSPFSLEFLSFDSEGCHININN